MSNHNTIKRSQTYSVDAIDVGLKNKKSYKSSYVDHENKYLLQCFFEKLHIMWKDNSVKIGVLPYESSQINVRAGAMV